MKGLSLVLLSVCRIYTCSGIRKDHDSFDSIHSTSAPDEMRKIRNSQSNNKLKKLSRAKRYEVYKKIYYFQSILRIQSNRAIFHRLIENFHQPSRFQVLLAPKCRELILQLILSILLPSSFL